MAKARFTVSCMAVYTSELEIPDKIVRDKNAVVRYIRDHLPDCNVNDLKWVDDMEPEAAVTESDIIRIDEDNEQHGRGFRFGGQFRATDIKWDTHEVDKKDLVNTLPSTVIIPDEYIVNGEDIENWLSDEYGFLHDGYSLIYITENRLRSEEEYLKRKIFEAGVNGIEEFLGHPLDDNEADLESEMNDVLTQIPDEEYIAYLQKYKIIQ